MTHARALQRRVPDSVLSHHLAKVIGTIDKYEEQAEQVIGAPRRVTFGSLSLRCPHERQLRHFVDWMFVTSPSGPRTELRHLGLVRRSKPDTPCHNPAASNSPNHLE